MEYVKFRDTIVQFKDKKTELEAFLNHCTHEPADMRMYDLLAARKSEFIRWLKAANLLVELQNFELVEPMTEFQWKCRQDILSMLCNFDMLMLQCIGDNDGLNRFDSYLRERMVHYSKEYEGM